MNIEKSKNAEISPFAILCEYVQKAEERKKVLDKYHDFGESYLAFTAGDKYYLLDMKMVQEVSTSVQEITPLPFTPHWLLGLVGIRGEVFSVVDFKRFVTPSLPIQNTKSQSGFIILHNEGQGYILKVDSIQGIRSCEVSNYQSTRSWLNGQAAMDGLQWLRIDLKSLVTDASFIQNIQ
ncbi:MAG: chemotaxis protein CheW [Cardiobacteriaceae bacterium]|nr:chemotaxis protein CheW [Cardiobacteriaceae bacterium]